MKSISMFKLTCKTCFKYRRSSENELQYIACIIVPMGSMHACILLSYKWIMDHFLNFSIHRYGLNTV